MFRKYDRPPVFYALMRSFRPAWKRNKLATAPLSPPDGVGVRGADEREGVFCY